MSIRVVLVDDHAVVRSGLRRVLDAEADIEVVGEAEIGRPGGLRGDREQARRRAHGRRDARQVRHRGDAGRAPGGARREGARPLDAGRPALRARGVRGRRGGYVLKEAADTEVVGAIRAVAAGERYVHPALGARLVAAEAEERQRAEADPLSDREREVLRLLALGHTNQEIAKMLFISVRTAETHRAHIMQKLRLSSRAELVRYALENGLIEGLIASADDEHVARRVPHDLRADGAEHDAAQRPAAAAEDDEVGIQLAGGVDQLDGGLADRLEVRRGHLPPDELLAGLVERPRL